ncbi:hypothetical protein PG593_08530 [Riemerella anatipestifer]|nr:hypothetical protein [Riemerella anatipestifer]
MKTKFILILFCGYLFSSCDNRGHSLAFNLQKQVFYSCDSSPIRNLSIRNDSITIDGLSIEGAMLISWDGNVDDEIAKEISVSEIPKNYKFTKGGLKADKSDYKLRGNSAYLIEKFGGGKSSFYLRIWTDSTGKVFKTTHPECGLKSLQND